MIFELSLLVLVWYELIALYADKIPTVTEILKEMPLWLSVTLLVLLSLTVVDHIYFQWVMP